MREKAVIDRIVDGRHVVLLVGEGEVERIVGLDSLPQGVREGMWLWVRFEGERLVEAEIDREETEKAAARIKEKLEALRRRGLKGMSPSSPET